jgi:hypothetical protein
MAYTDRRSNQKIRFKSGYVDFRPEGETDWENLGKIEGGVLTHEDAELKASFMDSSSCKFPGESSCDLDLVLSQVDKAVQDRIDSMIGSSIEILIYNATVNLYAQEYYFPESMLLRKKKISMKGSEQQKIDIKMSVQPQEANVTVKPSTTFPAHAKSIANTNTLTGSNPFYIIIETNTSGGEDNSGGLGDGPA